MKLPPVLSGIAAYLKPVFAGLFTSQIIAWAQVYLSDINYHKKMTAIYEAGYVCVPGGFVMETLKSFYPAFMGGLFFTFTLGAAITIISLIFALFVKSEIFALNRFNIIKLAVLWAVFQIFGYFQGMTFLTGLYFFIIPPLVFLTALKTINLRQPVDKKIILIHLIFFVAMIISGSGYANHRTFSIIRDKFLLSTKPGIAINNFYYDYTLYAAQVFKSMTQDQLRAVFTDCDNLREIMPKRLIRTLLYYDYLPVKNKNAADLTIILAKDELKFIKNENLIEKHKLREFYINPRDILKNISEKTDVNNFFRQITFLSLLFVMAISIYFAFWLPVYVIVKFLFKAPKGELISPVISGMLIIITLIVISVLPENSGITLDNLKNKLESENLCERVEALKYIDRKELDIGYFTKTDKFVKSPHFSERYWFIQGLRYSRIKSTYEANLALLDDPVINVAYSAYLAMGHRKEGKCIDEILKRITKIKKWYVQLYAYKALRRLGWRQTVSR